MLARLATRSVQSLPPKALADILRTAPRELLHRERDLLFRETVRYACRRSPFYRRKFDEHRIDPARVRVPADLGDFYTTTRDLIEHAEEFLCRRAHIVFESSGTTGRNKRVYFTHDELDAIGAFNAVGMCLGGITADDRMVNAFDFNIWIPGMITHKSFERSRVFGMAAGKVDPAEIYKRIPVYGFNVIFGEPTWLIKLTEIAEREGAYPLKLIIGGAEEMPDAARPWMERLWRGAAVRMVYASVESGGIIAFEPYAGCGGYHIDEGNFLLEIADPDADGYGDVTFTTLTRRTMPLIRYRNRDIGRIIEEPCRCGLPYRRLSKMRGRSDEMVVASGGNLYPLMFQEIMKDVAGITSDWQIVFRLNGIKEVMEFNLELRPGASMETVREAIFANVRERYPDLWKNLSIAIFDTAFVGHRPDTLRVTKRKLLRLVDKRYTQ